MVRERLLGGVIARLVGVERSSTVESLKFDEFGEMLAQGSGEGREEGRGRRRSPGEVGGRRARAARPTHFEARVLGFRRVPGTGGTKVLFVLL